MPGNAPAGAPGQLAAACPAGQIICEAWCKKNMEPHKAQECIQHGNKSCMKKYGGLDACIR